MLPKFENALGLGCDCWIPGEVELEKLSPLKASFIPPNVLCCAGGDCCMGDCMPPKDPEDAWDGCCWGCGRGAEA